MSELPKGWEAPGLAEICDFNPKHDPDTDREQLISFVPMPAVSDETGTIETPQDRPLSAIWKGYTHFQNGDVIFAKITPCMENGKSAVAGDLTNGLACGSTEFHVLRPRGGVLPDYIWKFVRQVEFRRDAEAHMTGAVGQRRVPKPYLEKHPIPLPPLSEQRRIVGKLDTLGARTNTTRTHLSAIAKLVDKYKAGFVSTLFKGLSEQFGVIELESICDRITKGSSPKWQGFEYSNEGTIFVRSQNVLWGKLHLSDVTRLPAEFNNKQRNSVMEKNDVLLNIVGASIGRSAVVPNELVGANCNQAVAVIRLLEPNFEDASYLSQWLISPEAQSQITENAVDVARANFSLSQAKKLLIPWATTEARKSILIKIQAAFAKIDLLAAEAEKALKLTDRLDQRILAKAFGGELVSQDPTDEPASVLLDRVRAERASAPKPKRGRKKKADA